MSGISHDELTTCTIFSGPYIGEVKLTFFLSSNYLEFEIVAARGLQLVHQIEPGLSTIAK